MPRAPRLACVTVPMFPLAAHLRSEPALRDTPLAIVEGGGNAARLVAATRPARRAGVAAGMSIPQARALVPGLTFRGRGADAERAAQEALVEAAGLFSPRVESAGAGVVYLDVTGLERHAASRRRGSPAPPGKETGEAGIAWSLQAAVRRAGLPARVGIAGTKLAASRAAASSGGALAGAPLIVATGEEAAFLAPLPIDLLGHTGDAGHVIEPTVPEKSRTTAPLAALPRRSSRRDARTERNADERRADAETIATLARWGLHTIGAFAALSPREVATRLGAAGRRLHALARGLDPTPLFPAIPPPVFTEAADLDWAVVTLEPLLAVAELAFQRLTRRLATEGLGCLRLELTLRLDPDGHDVRSISLPGPTSCPKTLLDLTRLELDRRSPGAPVTGLTLTAHPDKPRRGQLTLFGPVEVSPDRLAAALARLAALLGESEGRLGAPLAVDGHRPERLALGPYAPPPPPTFGTALGEGAHGITGALPRRADGGGVAACSGGGGRSAPADRRTSLSLRVLRPAVALEVETEETDDGPRPAVLTVPAVSEASGRLAGRALGGSVREAVGPWWLEETWWQGLPLFRMYWDVELARGGLFRIFQEPDGPWFADGAYD